METLRNLAARIVEERQLSKIVRYTYSPQVKVMDLAVQVGRELCGNSFRIDAENEFCYNNTLRWLFGHPFWALNPATLQRTAGDHKRGLYIAGNCGTGKSVLLEILNALAGHYGIAYEFNGEQRKLCCKPQRADELCNEFMLDGAPVASRLKTANVLCINDLGSEPQEQLYMGNRVNLMRQVIEARGDISGIFTLISSNYPMLPTQNRPTKIKQLYGDRVESRLQGMCNYFELVGTDRRITH